MNRHATTEEIVDEFKAQVMEIIKNMDDTIKETYKTDPDPERTSAHRVNLILKDWHMKGLNMGYN